jgi:hypothetical protein
MAQVIDPTKRHHPVPLQRRASDNPFLEPRARHRVDPWLSTRARPVTQPLNAFLFNSGYAIHKPLTGSAPPRRFLMLHPLEYVCDHQNPLADTPALASCQAPQLGRPRPAAKKYAGIAHPPNVVRLAISSTTSGDHRKPVFKAAVPSGVRNRERNG